MAIEYLKRGKSDAARAEEDAKTAAVVTATLQDIETRGDAAVRELANKFDGYDRESYRLTASEIEALMAEVSPEDMADIKFAQEQVRKLRAGATGQPAGHRSRDHAGGDPGT